MKTILCSGFPGIGKSHFFNNSQLKVSDSDSSKFDKDYFPQNYIDHIIKNIEKYDIICISSHKEVREALVSNNLFFFLVYPHISLKNEYIERFLKRGSDKAFINLLSKNWNNWIEELNYQTRCIRVVLNKNEYLSDVAFDKLLARLIMKTKEEKQEFILKYMKRARILRRLKREDRLSELIKEKNSGNIISNKRG